MAEKFDQFEISTWKKHCFEKKDGIFSQRAKKQETERKKHKEKDIDSTKILPYDFNRQSREGKLGGLKSWKEQKEKLPAELKSLRGKKNKKANAA